MCSIEPPSPLTRAVATVPGSVTASWNTTMYWPGTTSGAARCATVSPGPPGPTGRVSTERDALAGDERESQRDNGCVCADVHGSLATERARNVGRAKTVPTAERHRLDRDG